MAESAIGSTMFDPEPASHSRRSRRDLGIHVAFRPGQAVMVQLTGDCQRYWGRVLGADPYECFIVKLPQVPGIKRLAVPGASLTLRLEHEGELFGFSCDVITAVFKPNPLAILAYPASTERLQLRRHKRLKCLIPAVAGNGCFSSSGFIVDMSLGGCKLILDERQIQQAMPLKPGDALTVDISLPNLGSIILKGKAVSLKDAGQDRALTVRFDLEDKKTRGSLGAFVSRLEAIERLQETKD